MSLFMVLDQGGQSVRALIIDQQGNVISKAQQAIATHYGKQGHIEQDPMLMVRHLRHCARKAVLSLNNIQQQQLKAAGLVTQRASLLAVDKSSHAPLSRVISWQDRRGGAALSSAGLSATEIRALTGLRLSPHYGAGKMLWCIKHLPQVESALAQGKLMFTPIASFLLQQLTGQSDYACDPVNASRTLLMNLHTAQWSDELLSRFQIPAATLPTIRNNDSDFGQIQLGSLSLPVRYLNGDQACALFSRGNPSTTTLAVNLGTGAFVSRLTDGEDTELLRSLVHYGQSQIHVLEGTVNGAASALQQVNSEVKSPQGTSDLLSRVDGLCADIPLFLNGVGGLGAPFWQANFTSGFIHPQTLQANNNAPALSKLTAVVESVVFLLQVIIQRLSVHPPYPAQIEISGGLSRLDYICQALADISGLEVHRQDEKEGSALGCAWWLAGCPQQWRSNHQNSRFMPRGSALLMQRFSAWQQGMKQALPAERGQVFDNLPAPCVRQDVYLSN